MSPLKMLEKLKELASNSDVPMAKMVAENIYFVDMFCDEFSQEEFCNAMGYNLNSFRVCLCRNRKYLRASVNTVLLIKAIVEDKENKGYFNYGDLNDVLRLYSADVKDIIAKDNIRNELRNVKR